MAISLMFAVNTTLSSGKPNRAGIGRRGALKLLEWIVLVAVVAFLVLLVSIPDTAARTRWEIERRIREWQPAPTDNVAPDDSLMLPTMEIVGNWSVHRGHDGSWLEIEESSDQTYRVKFFTAGCTGEFQTERVGKFKDGILTLDGPVAEYFPATYKKLYAVRVADEDFLLPSALVSRFEEGLATDPGSVEYKLKFSWSVYGRSDSSP